MKTTTERLIEKLSVDESGCWIWQASMRGDYGSFSFNGKTMDAHKASYIIFKGKVKDGLYVCHTCDTPLCINPKHLFLGTPQENVKDMWEKGRNAPMPRSNKKEQ